MKNAILGATWNTIRNASWNAIYNDIQDARTDATQDVILDGIWKTACKLNMRLAHPIFANALQSAIGSATRLVARDADMKSYEDSNTLRAAARFARRGALFLIVLRKSKNMQKD